MPARIALCASLILSTLLQFAIAQIAGGAYGGYTDTAYFLYPGNTTRYNTTNGGPENDPVNQANGGSLTLGEETSLSAVFPWGGPWVMRINVVDGFNGPTHWVTLDDVNETVIVNQSSVPYNWTWTPTFGNDFNSDNAPVLQGFLYIYAAFNCCIWAPNNGTPGVNGFYSDWINFTHAAASTGAVLPTSSATGTPAVAPPAQTSHTSSGGLSGGAKAGIGVGVALGVLCLAALIAAVIILHRKHKRSQREADAAKAAATFNRRSHTSPEMTSGAASGVFSTMSPMPEDEKRNARSGELAGFGELPGTPGGERHELPGSEAALGELDTGEKGTVPLEAGSMSPTVDLHFDKSNEAREAKSVESPKDAATNEVSEGTSGVESPPEDQGKHRGSAESEVSKKSNFREDIA